MESEANIVPTLLEKGALSSELMYNKYIIIYLSVLFHPNSARYRIIFIRI